MLKNLHPHPRLFLTDTGLNQLRERLKSDPFSQEVYAAVVAYADLLLNVEPLRYEKQGRRLLGVSRAALKRISALALVARLTDDDRYTKRAAAEMSAVCAFEDWNPSHFLDVAEMTLGVAIGYDWLYDKLSPQERTRFAHAILENGINPSFRGQHFWIAGTNNWNSVCHAGMVAGALVLADDQPELAERTIARAVTNAPFFENTFAPDGACEEGTTYWSYGATFHAILSDELRVALGDSFGVGESRAFIESGLYRAMMTAPSGRAFNYADSSATDSEISPALLWMGRQINRPDLYKLVSPDSRKSLKNYVSPVEGGGRNLVFALVWRRASADVSQTTGLPLDYSAGGENPVAVHRSAWGNPRSLFVGIKGGRASTSHAHMDAGAFVIEADGVRWAIDLGIQDYNRLEQTGLNIFGRDQSAARWTVFAMGAGSHNILRFNHNPPLVNGRASLVMSADTGQPPSTVVDLSETYADQANRVTRKMTLSKNNRVLIRDDWTLKSADLNEPKDVTETPSNDEQIDQPTVTTWQMLTGASVTIDKSSFVLRQGGERIVISVKSPSNAVLKSTPAKDLLQPFDAPLSDTHLLTIEVTTPPGGTNNIETLFTPGSADNRE